LAHARVTRAGTGTEWDCWWKEGSTKGEMWGKMKGKRRKKMRQDFLSEERSHSSGSAACETTA